MDIEEAEADIIKLPNTVTHILMAVFYRIVDKKQNNNNKI